MVLAHTPPSTNTRHNNSLLNGIAALRVLVRSGRSLGVTEIARELELSKSSTHDLIMSMVGLGFVDKNEETKRYLPSPAIFEFFGSFAGDFGRNVQMQYVLRRRAQELDATLYVSALSRKRSYVICASGRYGDTLVLGYNCPWYVSSCGRAVLSSFPETHWERCMPGPNDERPTDLASMDHVHLHAVLRETRVRGVAWNNGESQPDLTSVAAAIPVVGRVRDRAVAIVLDSKEMALRDAGEMERQVRVVARELASALGN